MVSREQAIKLFRICSRYAEFGETRLILAIGAGERVRPEPSHLILCCNVPSIPFLIDSSLPTSMGGFALKLLGH